MASGFNRKNGPFGEVHGYTVKAASAPRGSALGGLVTLALYVIGALVLAQFALPVLSSLGF